MNLYLSNSAFILLAIIAVFLIVLCLMIMRFLFSNPIEATNGNDLPEETFRGRQINQKSQDILVKTRK